ncbi:MAG: allophanate hydrolase [Porticoccaceae bacterium]|nr:allophanate hydrolase [Porticoccaceae bacterium]
MHNRLSISELRKEYLNREIGPREYIAICRQQIQLQNQSNPAWIYQLSDEELEPYLVKLEEQTPERLPLFGVPFAIKDNIDLAGIPTTAGCPDFSYLPKRSAFVVERLIQAGAVPLGKTNLDQFATGLVGVRSPWGACSSVFDQEYVSGGSSSGSAVSVAEGQVLFSLGTDTAGSGRIPAAFNNLIGLKPSRGTLSNTGMVRACRSLDCISIFALTAVDAEEVFEIAHGYDASDEYSRNYGPQPTENLAKARVAIPQTEQLEFFGDTAYIDAHLEALEIASKLGWELVEVDFSNMFRAAKMLYEGPWVAERDAAYGEFARQNPSSVLPVIQDIIAPAKNISATDTFQYQYEMQRIKKETDNLLQDFNFALIPSAPGHYLIEDLEKEPIKLNSQLGTYTNFMNLLDLCAIAIPAGFNSNEMPYGVTIFSRAFSDNQLLSYAADWQRHTELSLGHHLGHIDVAEFTGRQLDMQENGYTEILVAGAHMSGLPLNWQLKQLEGQYLQDASTAEKYSLYALDGGPPARPGLVRNETEGSSIDVEIWSLPTNEVGNFLSRIPSPLGLGKVELEDGRWVTGFICEPWGLKGAEDITHLKSWRNYQPD